MNKDTPKTVDELIAISVLELEFRPSRGWSSYLEARGIETLDDDLGRPSIRRADARALLADLHAERARMDAELQQMRTRMAAAASPVPRGLVPPDPDMSALEVMLSADAGRRPKSVQEQLLDAELTTSVPAQPAEEVWVEDGRGGGRWEPIPEKATS